MLRFLPQDLIPLYLRIAPKSPENNSQYLSVPIFIPRDLSPGVIVIGSGPDM